MDRKDFLVKTCGLCVVGSTLAYLDSCSKGSTYPENFTLDLSSSANSALQNVGGYVIQGDVIVIKTSSGYEALNLHCTHEGCTVSYNGSGFNCPCHGGKFDSSGKPTGGPPKTNLQSYTVTQSGNTLTIKG